MQLLPPYPAIFGITDRQIMFLTTTIKYLLAGNPVLPGEKWIPAIYFTQY